MAHSDRSTTTTTTPAAPPPTLSQALNERIRQLLKRERWSQREFAKRLGVTQGAVSYLLAEKRRAAALDYYERLAGVFGVSLSVLIADLEQQVGQVKVGEVGKGVLDAASSSPAIFMSSAAVEGSREETVLLRTLIDALIDARDAATDARIDARVEAAFATFTHGSERGAPPSRPRDRRGPAPKKRADDRRAHEPSVPADAGADHALSAGRHQSAGSVRRAG